MHTNPHLKLLFFINSAAGNNNTDWEQTILQYFNNKPYTIVIYHLSNPCTREQIQEQIKKHTPNRVIAVGGDGTLKLVTESIMNSGLPLGLLPAGSANGMAKELGIPTDAEKALDIITQGHINKIDLISINKELCIHLSDIGFNAFVVKTFETFNKRGMWSYIKAALRVLFRHRHMEVTIAGDKKTIKRKAAMVVIANATKYGTGAVINPNGKLDDGLFEIIVIKKISFSEIVKMMITHKDFDPRKTELFTTSGVEMRSKHHVHFQVDGEYLGKIYSLKAACLPGVLQMIVPASE
ncbi:diacylglycerol/lipid kinase family protein [Niastella sp. OAS944]|uniref:diacylglycerol/lipid kinase family protein n=1 Tax=Niastella sp. OAS944 TaxID=2664089 RepID=UPI00346E5F34|nr:YegS/Rv2252/BmrU family lipid kinase [Chitinophagaceae bacterium OAS944]